MPVIHINGQAMAAKVATSRFRKARGHMFRLSPPDYALVMPFDDVQALSLHMLFVRFPLTVAFVVDGVVQHVDRMQPWTGYATGRGDTLVELPTGALDISKGDTVEVT